MYSEENEKVSSTSFWRRLFHRRTRRLFTDLEREFQNYLDSFSIFSVVLLLFGVVFSLWNTAEPLLVRILLGLLFLAYGILHFWFFSKRRKFSIYKISVVYGILGFVGAICTFFASELSNVLLVFGLFLFLTTLERFFLSFYLIRLRDMSVSMLLVSMGLMVFMGVLLFINPFTHLYLGQVLGIFAILYGILNLTQLSFLSKKINDILSFFE